jgi:Cu2+-exporting ATPase/Cu+-exporting ATPase
VRGRALRLRVGNAVEPFCCYGCYLVLRVTREPGPGGLAHGMALRLGLALFFAMNAMMFSLPGYFPYVYGSTADAALFLSVLRAMALLLTLPVLILLGVPVLWQALRDARQLVVRTDALVAIGTIAAYAVSVHHTITAAPHVYFDTVAMLLIFVTLGRYLEARAKADAGAVLARLRDGARRALRVHRDGTWQSVAVNALRRGDLIALAPGDVCPADGTIDSGTADFDESSLTGESLPSSKGPGARVIAGSTNLDGAVHVRAEHVGDTSTIGQLTRSVEDALAADTGWQRTADRLAGGLVVTAPLLALGTFGYWAYYGSAEHALLTALAVLVVACPCAFGIATPAALWVGVDEAARRGIVLRSAGTLERLARIRTVWFDKTGTLSTGRLRLTGIECAPDASVSAPDVLAVARVLESGIPHPIAGAILEFAASGRQGAAGGLPSDGTTHVSHVRYHSGLGVEGCVLGTRWFLGSRGFLSKLGTSVAAAEQRPAASGCAMSAWLARATAPDEPPAVVARLDFADHPRAAVVPVLRALREGGMTVGVLSGAAALDHEWQRLLGVLDIRLGLLPDEKVAQLRASGDAVAMVGDGLNDAPALAAADVGIALGTGRDLTREAAQVNILSNDLAAVPWLFRWSRQVHRTIVVNISWALLYNGAALTAAAIGLLNPVIAALAMIGSSAFIGANTRRLRGRAVERQDNPRRATAIVRSPAAAIP